MEDSGFRTPLPSPSKKQALPTSVPARASDSTRGSMAAAARTGYEDILRTRPMMNRQAVSRGHLTFAGRPLMATQSESALSFASSSSNAPLFQTTQEILATVHGSGGSRRENELRPMWDTVDSRESLFGGKSGGDEGEWGFGEGTLDFKSARAPLSFGDGPSVGRSPTRNTTQVKRAFGDEMDAEMEDVEMEMTEDEDEGEDVPSGLQQYNAPIGRTIAGRKGLGRTQSLPAQVFSSSNF